MKGGIMKCPMCNGTGEYEVELVYRCIVDGEVDSFDDCAIEKEEPSECAYSHHYKKKEDCPYWKQVEKNG
jgi:hypothetical protein